MKNIFKEVQVPKVNFSKFDLTHDRKFSCDMGELIPIMVQEVLPNDTFKVTSEQLIRLAPMLSPMMHRVDVYTHFFFVPNRLVWKNFEKFISPDDPNNAPEHPFMNLKAISDGFLGDYMGLPTNATTGLGIPYNPIPFAAYFKIFNEYYRDQNLVTEVADTLGDGDNNTTPISNQCEDRVLLRAWEHDYFTACLPFAQKGDPVSLPLSGTAEINWIANGNPDQVRNPSTGALLPTDDYLKTTGGDLESYTDPDGVDASIDNSDNLQVDLSTATSSSINDFRRAVKLQEWLEKNARGGTRYIESIFMHFNRKSSDARLQRPEYLGGGRSPVMISEVLQTSANASEPTELGTMAGHGLNVGKTHQFSRNFEEHGYIIGIMSVMPKTAYFQGLPRHFSRFDVLDYPWPTFAHIGEQEVLNKEVHIDHATPDGTFGYIPRYSECRFTPSSVHGDMRGSLDFWHMARDLPTTVALNEDFIQCQPTKRMFAVQDSTDSLWCHVLNHVTAIRPLPKYGIPKM